MKRWTPKATTVQSKPAADADPANPAVPPDPNVIDVATTGTQKQARINQAGRKQS